MKYMASGFNDTGLTPITAQKEQRDIAESQHDGYFMRVLKALDVFINVVFLRGHLDETISSHAGRAAYEGKVWGIYLTKFLNIFDSNHALNAQAGDIGNAEQEIGLEEGQGDLPKL